jgi:hypothetical protein
MQNEHSDYSDPVAHADQRAQNPWLVLKQIWMGQYPPESPKPESLTLVVKLVVTPVLLVRRLSPSTFLRKKSPNVIDAMVLAWTLLTTLVLLIPTLRGGWIPSVLALSFAWFRLIDTISQKAMEILVHSMRPPLLAGIQRGVVLGALNLYEIIAAYAIIYLLTGGVAKNGEQLVTATSALYFSVVTTFTVGYGDFVPMTDTARQIVMSEIAGVAVFILAWFPRIVALLFPPRNGTLRNAQDQQGPAA